MLWRLSHFSQTILKMRLSLHKKLVIAILLSISSVIFIMLLLMSWSFDRGFKAHVLAEEERNDEILIESLIEHYRDAGDWSFLSDNSALWAELTFSSHRKAHQKRPRKPPEESDRKSPPSESSEERRPPPPRKPKSERVLLDVNKQVVIGNLNLEQFEDYLLKPVLLDNETIAYLAREPLTKIINPRQRKFMRDLQELFLLIAGSAIAIAIIISWLLSRNMLKPIKHLREGTTALASGDYSKRIEITSKDELGELSQHFNLLANTLEKNEQSRKQWIADISHELRTPLSILRGEIEALIDGVRKLDDKRLKSLHQEVLHLNQLIDDLHELSMSDIGALNYEMERHNIINLLDQSVDSLQVAADEKSIKIDKQDISKDEIVVLCDEHRIQQLFTNILMNSISYTNSDGVINIKAVKSDNEVIIDFTDSSPGVDEDELPKLFERLYRADSSRNRNSGGSGLGLSICANIVEAHDGKITADASDMDGLWIRVTLPLQQS